MKTNKSKLEVSWYSTKWKESRSEQCSTRSEAEALKVRILESGDARSNRVVISSDDTSFPQTPREYQGRSRQGGVMKSEDKGFIAEGSEAVNLFQLIAVKSAIKLEALGMKHSSGRSVRKMWAVHLGLKPSAKADEVIAAIQSKIDAAHSKGVGFRRL